MSLNSLVRTLASEVMPATLQAMSLEEKEDTICEQSWCLLGALVSIKEHKLYRNAPILLDTCNSLQKKTTKVLSL